MDNVASPASLTPNDTDVAPGRSSSMRSAGLPGAMDAGGCKHDSGLSKAHPSDHTSILLGRQHTQERATGTIDCGNTLHLGCEKPMDEYQ
ncbi:MAG: hypothetical protein IPM54_19640 [Polyangiaceae bacterium]|nr:hypothetical protein [Polyangiaceae bacterium]